MAGKKIGGYKKSELALTKLQRRFVLEYPKHAKLGDAVVAAGSKTKDPYHQGWRWMKDPRIKTRIDQNAAARRRYEKVTEKDIDKELTSMGFANIQDTHDEHGNLIPLQNLPREVAAGIKKLKIHQSMDDKGELVTDAEIEVTTDKKGALELLGRARGMWDKKDGGGGLGAAYIESLGRTVGPMGSYQEENTE